METSAPGSVCPQRAPLPAHPKPLLALKSCNAQNRQNGCLLSSFSAALLIAFPEVENYTKIEINGECERSALSKKLLGLKKTHCTKSVHACL